ncbi:Tyrosyl-tRNA synthetase [Hordeum vulgare]|nr:Tyrosyl-tRNA synthetase [Hordeum vulgare]
MKFHFMMRLNNDITMTIFMNTYKPLDDLYISALKAIQALKKAKDSPPQENFATTKLKDEEHDRMPLKENSLEASEKVVSKDVASIFGGESEMIDHGIFLMVMEAIDDVPSSAFNHDDGDETIEHGIFPSTRWRLEMC